MAEDTAPSRQQRKIPREAWKTIMTRHRTGESLASIARAYECTAPAIGYIVRQGRKSGDPVATPPVPRAAGRRPRRTSAPGPIRPGPLPSAGFDLALREAMTLEISSFLVAFDAVVTAGGAEAFDRLRGATDHLLRPTARVRIALER